MSNPYVGEIELFGFNFAPQGWALCQGQLLSISQNTALFSLLGTQYGGDGRSTFGLPNLQGLVPVGQGQGPGLSSYTVGQTGGTATVTLNSGQIAAHTHTLPASSGHGTPTPSTSVFLGSTGAGIGQHPKIYDSASNAAMSPQASLPSTGGGGPHNNMAPYVSMNFCIALTGVFPPRN